MDIKEYLGDGPEKERLNEHQRRRLPPAEGDAVSITVISLIAAVTFTYLGYIEGGLAGKDGAP